MTTAKDVMHRGATCVDANVNLTEAARMMRDLGVGALPICGEDGKLKGIITDRDIVVKCLAEGKDPDACSAIELAQGKPFYVDAQADIETVLQEMIQHKIKRLPVIENRTLVGIVSEADLAQHLPEEQVGRLVEAIKSGPADHVS
ncbi:CBS domain-containing protein [Thermobifida cellulosilytica]|uniref:Hypoxic response protein 1 n=1 Tax=Thermobifida cellulosilytica TB100 TaxID=665004 RepID=A0A147KFI8_THECS|nr:CBS domain-containing protein [Thermobifida cellulosilytica]KUP96053.1 hypoxic response protein 1 [Thermobifida cellulosilytica TB100]